MPGPEKSLKNLTLVTFKQRSFQNWNRNVLEMRALLQFYQVNLSWGFYIFSSCLGADLKQNHISIQYYSFLMNSLLQDRV